MGKKKFSELDLIEKYRVQIWEKTRVKLRQHLDHLEKKLEGYDLSDMPADDGANDQSYTQLESILKQIRDK